MAGPLVRWNMPDGTPVSFRDCRPGATTAEPDDSAGTLAAFEIITKAMGEAPGHEGRHAAVAMLFDLPVVEAHAGFPAEDGILGHIKFGHDTQPLDRMRLAEHAVTLIAGPLGDKTGAPVWPPRSDDGMAGYSDEKALADIVRRLNLNQRQYEGLVDVARTITSHPGIKRVEAWIGTLLNCGLTLSAKMLTDIHESAWREIAEETRPRTQDELEYAELREQQRSWWTNYLSEAADYHERQADEKAARDLRRRAMELAAEIEQQSA